MEKHLLLLLSICLVLFVSGFAADADGWRSRSIYQVLTDRFAKNDNNGHPCKDIHDYCGGTFVALKNKLDYITSMGFDAIWISPVIENTEKGYHGYWGSDLYKINGNFGTAEELKDLVNTAHAKGIWVMVDVVANHVGPVLTNFSQINPFNDASHYHSRCQIGNWSNQTEVEYCRLADLPDLDQNNSYVRKTLLDWIKNLVAEYSFDGIRIDTIPEVSPDFWAEFKDAAGVYQVGEISSMDYQYIAGYQNYVDATLNYALYYELKHQFGMKASMTNFRKHFEKMEMYKDQFLLGTFVDNHDNPRFLNLYSDARAFKAALAFVFCTKGIPITYYGSEQLFVGGSDPYNREPLWTSLYRWTEISTYLRTLNNARKTSGWYNHAQVERYVDDDVYAFTRCDIFFAFTNRPDFLQNIKVTNHQYSEGDVLCDLFKPNDCVTVQDKQFKLTLHNGEAKILLPQRERLGGCAKVTTDEYKDILFLEMKENQIE